MNVPERLIDTDALTQIAPLLARHAFGHTLILVCDELTWIAAGERVQAALSKQYRVTIYSLGHEPHAERRHAEELIAAAQSMDGFIAVGSGTVNDITKYAAANLGKPYICVATAASMNGYTSANASLEVDGLKQSFAAAPPRAVVVDLQTIMEAPLRLARSGLGDALCRSTVETDMIMVNHLFGTPYPRALFDKLRAHEKILLGQAEKLAMRDPLYLRTLMEALLDGGDAMTEHRSSAVASQGEHMIAHTIELLYSKNIGRVRHGELVAVTTLTMANIQRQILNSGVLVKSLRQKPSVFLRAFGQYMAESVEATYEKKILKPKQVSRVNAIIANEWDELKRKTEAVMVPEIALERALLLAGVPTRPIDIKLDLGRYKHAVSHAYLTRDRFTFLDLAAMMEK